MLRGAHGAEASRFGIMNTDADDRIVEFEEKPKNPKTNKASMGDVYLHLGKAASVPHCRRGKQEEQQRLRQEHYPRHAGRIIRCLCAYNFDGYWKDVGTIESLWEANMDLLATPMPIDLHDKKWRIYARNPGMARSLHRQEARRSATA